MAALQRALGAVLGACALACALAYAAYLFYSGTDSFQALQVTSLEFPPLDGSTVLTLLWTWGPLLAAVLCTLALRQLGPRHTQHSKPHDGAVLWVSGG